MLEIEEQLMIRDIAHEVEREYGRLNISEVSRRCGYDRRTVEKYLAPSNLSPKPSARIRTSKLDPYKPYITERLTEGPHLTAKRIYREIRDKGYAGKYSILADYLHRERRTVKPLAVYRFETEPGHQAQVDWGFVGEINLDGKDRPLYVFTMILGYSRMRFVKFTLSMDVQTLIQCHIEAFQYYSGIPKEILYDNMKTVVTGRSAQTNEKTYNQTFLDFADFCGFTIRTCKPNTPKTKGKIENTVKYVKTDFYYASSFTSFHQIEYEAYQWMERVNNEIHGTTHEIPYIRLSDEQKMMKIPDRLITYHVVITEKRKVTNDSYISYLGNKYSVPYHFANRYVTLKISNGTFKVYFSNEMICEHTIVTGKDRRIRIKEHFTGLLEETMKQNTCRLYSGKHVLQLGAVDVESRSLDVYEQLAAGGNES